MKGKRLVLTTVILTAVLAAWRTLLLPTVVGDGRALTSVSYPLAGLMAVTVALLLLFGREKNGYAVLYGRPAQTVAMAGVVFGGALTAVSLYDTVRWLKDGLPPAPVSASPNVAEQAALLISLLCGIVGGVFLMAYFAAYKTGVYAGFSDKAAAAVAGVGVAGGVALAAVGVIWAYRQGQQTGTARYTTGGVSSGGRLLITLAAVVAGVALVAAFGRWYIGQARSCGWLWLLPVVWLFARLVRYDIAYAMQADIAPAAYELVLYGVAFLWLLSLARHMAGVQKPTGCLRGLSAATAALSLAAIAATLVLTVLGKSDAAAYCPLPNVADAFMGLFALTCAGCLRGETPARHAAAESAEEPATAPAAEPTGTDTP